MPIINVRVGMPCYFVEFDDKKVFPAKVLETYSNYDWDIEIFYHEDQPVGKKRAGGYNRNIFLTEAKAYKVLGQYQASLMGGSRSYTGSSPSGNRCTSCGAMINNLYQCRCS